METLNVLDKNIFFLFNFVYFIYKNELNGCGMFLFLSSQLLMYVKVLLNFMATIKVTNYLRQLNMKTEL